MPSEFDLTPEQAHAVVQAQQAMCAELFVREITHVSQLDPVRHDTARIHLATCPENHYPVAGLYGP